MATESNHPTPPPPEASESDLLDFEGLRQDLGLVLTAPLRHPRLAVGSFLSVAVLAAASSLVIRDVYQVQAEILAQRNPVMLTLSNPGIHRGD
ncbi:MAG TPA: hypothetical protein VH880_07515, partial [Anaeromyxobacteraceae bacterium]